MSKISNFLKGKFSIIEPGETVTHSYGYTARPQTSTWYRIEDLDEIRNLLKKVGIKITPRFRGPNWKPTGAGWNSNKTILKENARYFSITEN